VTGLRIIACTTFARSGPSELHDLARAFRHGDPDAVERVTVQTIAGLRREAPGLAATTDVTVVPMAGHVAGTGSGSADRLAVALAEAHPGWTTTAAIERVADAPRAMDATARVPAAEAATLRWSSVHGTGPILLVDDVVHTGASLEAAWLAAPPELRGRLIAIVAFRAQD
jgi:hypothetical protein